MLGWPLGPRLAAIGDPAWADLPAYSLYELIKLGMPSSTTDLIPSLLNHDLAGYLRCCTVIPKGVIGSVVDNEHLLAAVSSSSSNSDFPSMPKGWFTTTQSTDGNKLQLPKGVCVLPFVASLQPTVHDYFG